MNDQPLNSLLLTKTGKNHLKNSKASCPISVCISILNENAIASFKIKLSFRQDAFHEKILQVTTVHTKNEIHLYNVYI